MTRKKFIKMLQARGIGRDAARAAAWLAQHDRVPYFKALGDFLTMLDLTTAHYLTGCSVTQPGNCWVKYGWRWPHE